MVSTDPEQISPLPAQSTYRPTYGQTNPWTAHPVANSAQHMSSSDHGQASPVHFHSNSGPVQPMASRAHGQVSLRTPCPCPAHTKSCPPHEQPRRLAQILASAEHGQPRPWTNQPMGTPAKIKLRLWATQQMVNPAEGQTRRWPAQTMTSTDQSQPSPWPFRPMVSPARGEPKIW